MTISIALDAGPLQKSVQQALTDLSEDNILHRISARDYTVWQQNPD